MFEDYFVRLENVCKEKGFVFNSLKSDDGDILVKIIVNPDSKKPTLCFSGAVHGNEDSGPWGILDFLEGYLPDSEHPRMVFLPVLNPYGFMKGIRSGRGRFNLNRHFIDLRPFGMVKCIHSAVKGEGIEMSFSFHEDEELQGCYVYEYSDELEMAWKVIGLLSGHLPVCLDRKIYGNSAEGGVINMSAIDGSFEEWMFRQGVKVSQCVELPDQSSMDARRRAVKNLIGFVLKQVTGA